MVNVFVARGLLTKALPRKPSPNRPLAKSLLDLALAVRIIWSYAPRGGVLEGQRIRRSGFIDKATPSQTLPQPTFSQIFT